MKEIEFRAWDGEKMFTPGPAFRLEGGILSAIEGVTLMQYTGLKDKLDNKVYSGDILTATCFCDTKDYGLPSMSWKEYDEDFLVSYSELNELRITNLREGKTYYPFTIHNYPSDITPNIERHNRRIPLAIVTNHIFNDPIIYKSYKEYVI